MTPAVSGDPFSLTGRVALVTGGGSGIGRAICLGLARQGAAVAVADINHAGAQDTAGKILAAGQSAVSINADVTDPDSVKHMFDRAEVELGPVEILVNDAFVPAPRVPSETTPLDAWERVMKVNLTGYFLCAQEAGRRLIEAGRGGSIINLSSITSSTGVGRSLLAYGVSKGAVNQLTRELAVEWGPFGIRVNAVQPCQILTPALQAFLADPANDGESLVATFLRGIPLGRLGLPEDIVGAVIFLASDAAAMVTGALLPVDGGNLAMNAGGTLRQQ